MKGRLVEALIIAIAAAIVARVVYGLLGPLLPVLGMLLVLAVIGGYVLRRN